MAMQTLGAVYHSIGGAPERLRSRLRYLAELHAVILVYNWSEGKGKIFRKSSTLNNKVKKNFSGQGYVQLRQ
jgi:hypothetical protein